MEVSHMTLNILFLTVTIKKRLMTENEYRNYEMLKTIEEENRNRQAAIQHYFF
jgi:uncharacterized protein (TIGR02413 family)